MSGSEQGGPLEMHGLKILIVFIFLSLLVNDIRVQNKVSVKHKRKCSFLQSLRSISPILAF